jgi:hypothetical protein
VLRRGTALRFARETLLSRVRRPARRVSIIIVAVVVAALAVLFPPWSARAVRTTTRYAAVAGVAPSIVVDTLEWSLSFVPIWSPPRAPLNGDQIRALALRSLSGDANARAELRRSMDEFERRYHAPEVIRMTGEVWRDSVLAAAGIPGISSYEATFSLDERWIAARLLAIALAALFLERRQLSRARNSTRRVSTA